MITDLVLSALRALFDLLTSLLPVVELSFLPDPGDIGTTIGNYLGPIDRVFPSIELIRLLSFLFKFWLPCVLTYTLTLWVYRHIPVVGAG